MGNRLSKILMLLSIMLPSVLAKAQNGFSKLTLDSAQQYAPVPNTKQIVKAGAGLPLFQQSSVSSSSFWKTIALDVTLERKVASGLSLIGSLETNYGFSRYAQLYSIDLPLGLRYYFSVGRKMQRRVDKHSFFSHYVSIQTHNSLFSSLFYNTPNPNVERYYRGSIVDNRTNIGKYDEAFNLMQHAYFQIGSQFKISQRNYLDVNAAIPIPNLIYHKTEFTLSTPAYLTIKYGVVWKR